MSDAGRKSMTDKASETMKPDSQKSYTEMAGEKISGAYDSVAGTAQSSDDKSATQKMGDTATGTGSDGKSMLDSAKEKLGMDDNSSHK